MSDGCCNYVTRNDARTALENSGYVNWYVGEDAHIMTEDEMEEIVLCMWHGQLCPGHGMKAWLLEKDPENLDQYDLPDGFFCTAAESRD